MQNDFLNSSLKKGGVIGFETDTVWGIGALPSSETGVNNIYKIKNRDRSKPLILMSNDIKYLLPFVKELPEKAKMIVDLYFPGAVTLVVEKSVNTPDFITNNMKTVGIRVPNHFGFMELCKKIDGHVLATTSANISNDKTSICKSDVVDSIGKNLFAIYGDDTDILKVASTVVFVDQDDNVKVLRQGSINLKDCI